MALQHFTPPCTKKLKDEIAIRDTEQKLAFAYLSERLFTIYFRYQQNHNRLRIKEFPFALASNFFEPPAEQPFIILKTPQWQDVFIDQKENRICSFNNSHKNCGKFVFLPENRLHIKWDDGETSIFRHSLNNEFELEN